MELREQSRNTADADRSLETRLREALAPNLQLLRAIGAGGMAQVFLAREPSLKRLVAVKVLSEHLSTDPESRIRFEREAQAVATLSHPNVVAIHGVGELSDGTPYFVMQYVNGRSLASRIEADGPLPVAEGKRALAEVCAALAAAHGQGIIHRDIKAANILCEEATGRVLVSDFGIAATTRHDGGMAAMRLTGTGMIIGTPQYMSPEQMLAEPVTEKTDIYSVGLLAHEVLAGSSPFRGTTPQELIAAHLRDVPPRLSERRLEVDPELDALVARCLEKDPAKRPSADDAAKRLAPGGAALLEWPPPGLELLHGQAGRLSSMYWLGGTLSALALVPLLSSAPSVGAVASSPTGIFLALAIGGTIAMGEGMRRSWRVGKVLARALRGGYGWLTIAEVFSDRSGDTGAVISGSGEYAVLTPSERDRMRQRRVTREALYLAGGVSILPLLFLIVIAGASGLPLAALWIALAAPVVAAAAAWTIDITEARRFGRRRRKALADIDPALTRPWYASFESARSGQSIGGGRTGAPGTGRLVALATIAVCALALLMLSPLMLVANYGSLLFSSLPGKFASVDSKAELSSLMRPYALPKDDRITALDAGRALRTLFGPSDDPGLFVEKPVPGWSGTPWRAPHPDDLFEGMRRDQILGLPSTVNIIRNARRLSPREIVFLDSALRRGNWAAFDTLARARRLDYAGGMYRLPLPADATVEDMPLPRYSFIKTMAYASSSRAALYLARGQRDSAELALRATVSAGLLLMDEDPILVGRLIGIVMVGIGHYNLVELYNATNDPRGAALQARWDAARSTIETRVLKSTLFDAIDVRDPAAIRDAILRFATDSTAPRGMRYEMLYVLGMSTCSNIHEFVFGPARDVRDAFETARKTWARSAGDTALLNLAFDAPSRGSTRVSSDSLSRTEKLMLGMGRIGGVGLHNRRFMACARFLTTAEF
jgi:hypothetical protein